MRFNLRIFGPIDIDAVRIRSFEKHRNEEMSYRIIKTISLLNSQVITANNVNVKKLPSAFCVQSIKSYNLIKQAKMEVGVNFDRAKRELTQTSPLQ